MPRPWAQRWRQAVVADIPNYATGGAVILNYPVHEARLR
jgi:hypothetical protein